jgi:hypothetical protein
MIEHEELLIEFICEQNYLHKYITWQEEYNLLMEKSLLNKKWQRKNSAI